MKKSIFLLIILMVCQGLAFAEIKRELVLAIDRSGVEVVISKIGKEGKSHFAEYVVKIEANKAFADLSNTNAFILENPNRFVIDIPGSSAFKEESIFLADKYMALLRFGTHADKKRLVIDIESSSIFNLDKNINSKNSISYKLALTTGSKIPKKSELVKDSEAYSIKDSGVLIDMPTAKELESYLSPQSERYVKEIIASKRSAAAKEEVAAETILNKVEHKVVSELREIEQSKNSSFMLYYFLITCLVGLILFHKTKTRRQKRNYFRALKELRSYSFNSIIKNQKRVSNFKNAKINSLGQVQTNPNRKNNQDQRTENIQSSKESSYLN